MEEKRRYPRYIVEGMDFQAKTVSAVEVDILNISAGGISISSPKRLNIGGRYYLKFADMNGKVSLNGEVVWEKLSGSSRQEDGTVLPIYTAGLKFLDVTTPAMDAILDFIEEQAAVTESRLGGVRFRIRTSEKATIGVPLEYCVQKLSLGGMAIVADQELTVGDRMQMELILADNAETIEFEGRIASCLRPDQDEERFHIGVEFVAMDEKNRTRLAQVIADIQSSS